MISWLRGIKSRSFIRLNSGLKSENLKNHLNETSFGIFKSQPSPRFIQTTKEPENKISNFDTTTIAKNLWKFSKNKVFDKVLFSLYLKELYRRDLDLIKPKDASMIFYSMARRRINNSNLINKILNPIINGNCKLFCFSHFFFQILPH